MSASGNDPIMEALLAELEELQLVEKPDKWQQKRMDELFRALGEPPTDRLGRRGGVSLDQDELAESKEKTGSEKHKGKKSAEENAKYKNKNEFFC